MRLSVAANLDLGLLPLLAAHAVDEVFGYLPGDLSGGGGLFGRYRPAGWESLARYLQELEFTDIAFNYVIAPADAGRFTCSRRRLRRLTHLLNGLVRIGVTRLTVCDPALAQLVKREFPVLRLEAGQDARIDSPQLARFWQGLGADVLAIDGRQGGDDLSRLRAIRSAVGCELRLVVNSADTAAKPASDAGPQSLDPPAWIGPEQVEPYEAIGYSAFRICGGGLASSCLPCRVEAHARPTCKGMAGLFPPSEPGAVLAGGAGA